MSLPQQAQHHVCLPCLLHISRCQSSASRKILVTRTSIDLAYEHSKSPEQIRVVQSGRPQLRARSHNRQGHLRSRAFSSTCSQASNSTASESTKETISQSQTIVKVRRLRERLRIGLQSDSSTSTNGKGAPIETVLNGIAKENLAEFADTKIIETVQELYSGRSTSDVKRQLDKITSRKSLKNIDTISSEGKEVLNKLGITDDGQKTSEKEKKPTKSADDSLQASRKSGRTKKRTLKKAKLAKRKPVAKVGRRSAVRRVVSKSAKSRTASKNALKSKDDESNAKSATVSLTPSELKSLSAIDSSTLKFSAVDTGTIQKIPRLSFDLSRVLFNPGVYQLQDPRSRVYNFDPYLQHIIPIQQFNFEALNKYMTSSEDTTLREIAVQRQKKYVGSSSSMTGVLSHFHYLLSSWRPLSINAMSREFRDETTSFTQLTRGPCAVFLRLRNNSYAVDADKEYDTSNVLMNMGKALEKLLTLEKNDFERYRRSPGQVSADLMESEPEAFHYSEFDDFLMRSQLDAFDPRLPGTGTFDLKTRAVAGIRMDLGDYESGKGYQIKDRLGTWESYEREYFDMMRSAFLKYSLQVRMGRMDGIFVAFHNIARMFGFQYIPVSELDAVLHGQSDSTLGDREFCLSIRLMNEIFNMSTEEFSQQSIRFHFETRPVTKGDPHGAMLIFAEPMTEEEIQKIQDTGKAKAAEKEHRLLYPDSQPTVAPETQSATDIEVLESNQDTNVPESAKTASESETSFSTQDSTAADVGFLDQISQDETQVKAVRKPLAAWKLSIYNEVNGKSTVRPKNLQKADQWQVRYKFERLNDDNAWVKYKACKNRRKANLVWPEERPESFFLSRIRDLSQKGAVWRKEQDEMEAGREKIVLYDQVEKQ